MHGLPSSTRPEPQLNPDGKGFNDDELSIWCAYHSSIKFVLFLVSCHISPSSTSNFRERGSRRHRNAEQKWQGWSITGVRSQQRRPEILPESGATLRRLETVLKYDQSVLLRAKHQKRICAELNITKATCFRKLMFLTIRIRF